MTEPTMIAQAYDVVLTIALILTSVLTLACSYRVIRGPTAPDRVVGLETVATNVVAIAVLVALLADRGFYVLIALELAIVGFVSTIAVAKFVIGGDVIR